MAHGCFGLHFICGSEVGCAYSSLVRCTLLLKFGGWRTRIRVVCILISGAVVVHPARESGLKVGWSASPVWGNLELLHQLTRLLVVSDGNSTRGLNDNWGSGWSIVLHILHEYVLILS